VGDFDGDGDEDLVVPNESDQGLRFYRNGGVALSALRNYFRQSVIQLRWCRVGDMNGDGLLDLFAADLDSANGTWLYRGTPAGGLEVVMAPPFTTDKTRSHVGEWRDYDLDGTSTCSS